MWLFNRNHWSLNNLLKGFSDCHSHILPGVDDGVQTMEEALALLHRYEELGITTIWLTPHIMEDIPNMETSLRKKHEELLAAYDGPLIIHLAAEYMLDNLFSERLGQGDMLSLGQSGKFLLVETSYFNPPMELDDILLDIKKHGYIPMLAHPERYYYMDDTIYDHLKSLRIGFQLNLFSLAGAYGRDAIRKAMFLLKKGHYDCVGMDVHSIHFLETNLKSRNRDRKVLSYVQEIINKNILKN